MNYTYILKSKRDSKLYVGSTTNLRKRFWQHANGKSSYTKSRGPFALIYYEACVDEGDARSREKYLKSGRGKRFIKDRLKRFLFRTG
ncbi:MAG: excinuclease ABC subunit C [Candidatus Zambryskibacteria bacterium RIFCSPHIGHO2_01_FULL_43_27]|nr:MAG: excinuclease ABC subunit C [Candidatus Zambryskibacteria bacterium RIFCSPHIGHO2_01_FULL_43_27]